MVNLKINRVPVTVPEGTTILDAAKKIGLSIPTLCYLREINEIGACRVCTVEIKGGRALVASCVYPVSEGMEVLTNTERVIEARKKTIELILSTHDRKCLSCIRSGSCELQALSHQYGIEDEGLYDGERHEYAYDTSSRHLIRDNNKCVLCRRCVAACEKQDVAVLGANNRGFDTAVGCAFNKNLGDVACVSCGQCIVRCPTGALRELDETDRVIAAIDDPEKHVVVHTAPSIRVALGEEFGYPIGTNVKGKMVAALRRLGFDRVFDTDVGADLTIMEEANELAERIKYGGTLPMITSCSPGWIQYCEYYFPELLPNLSTCKSPQQMTGAVIKTWYADRMGLDPKNIVDVSIMPCTAKKFEADRPDQSAAGNGIPDVDIALTTRELARLIKRAHIDFTHLPDEAFDPAIGITTGAGAIFGTTGGVMEAALRTASDLISGEQLEKIDYKEVRGPRDVKEAVYAVGGHTVKVAAVSGLSAAREVLEKIRDGKTDYDFVEIMCCPGGCVNGGGQPIQPSSVYNFENVKDIRGNALYEEDKNLPLRKSHESPVIKQLYSDYFGKPGSHKAHKVLHTSYTPREKYDFGG